MTDRPKRRRRPLELVREVGGVFAGMFHVYRAWWADIMLLAAIIFIPLGLVDAADAAAIEALGDDQTFAFLALLLGAAIVAATGVLGEVFFAGAVGLSLAHAENGRPPSLRFIARRLDFGRLIAVDLLYVLILFVGIVFFIAPGLAAFAYLALAGPVVEMENRGVRAAFARSFRLVRGNFWLVFLVLFPIEFFGGSVNKLVEQAVEAVFGHSFVAVGLAEAAADILISPLFAIAAVLLTRKLIAAEAGSDSDGLDLKELRPNAGLTRSG